MFSHFGTCRDCVSVEGRASRPSAVWRPGVDARLSTGYNSPSFCNLWGRTRK